MVRIAPSATIEVATVDDGARRARVGGVATCGSVWECPVCARRVRAARATLLDVLQAQEGGMMMTYTIRHDAALPLALGRRVIARAWQYYQAGRGWRSALAMLRAWGTVRALEITHGDHGWHPHLHVWVSGMELDDDATRAAMLDWCHARWSRCVARAARALGVDPKRVAPLRRSADGDDVGVHLSELAEASYLADASLGLELTDAGGAKGRSPWQIARGAADGRARDARLWIEYTRAMRGSRAMTWSRSLAAWRRSCERQEREELAQSRHDWRPAVVIPGWLWDLVRWDRDAVMTACARAEELGADADHGPTLLELARTARAMPAPRGVQRWPRVAPLYSPERAAALRAAAIARIDARLADRRREQWERARARLLVRLRARAESGLDRPHWTEELELREGAE